MATLIIHGGAGAREGDHAGSIEYANHVREIVVASFPVLLRQGARAAVIDAIKRLEDDPLFNAGTGSRLQRDGAARMSAAIIDSDNQSMAGVINIEDVRHPIAVAASLQGARHCMLAGNHATTYARAAGFDAYDVVTRHRREELARTVAGETGTVGAVAVDESGCLCAGTSTGGVGNEVPGRVSDSATVAGTFVSANAGVSCTGVGEEIVNQAVAARVVTRVDDGATLVGAADRTASEGAAVGFRYGLIALDRRGRHAVVQTPGITTVYAVTDGEDTETFFD